MKAVLNEISPFRGRSKRTIFRYDQAVAEFQQDVLVQEKLKEAKEKQRKAELNADALKSQTRVGLLE